jgi:hypothetical protein
MFLLEYVMHVVIGVVLVTGVLACLSAVCFGFVAFCEFLKKLVEIAMNHWVATVVISTVVGVGVKLI